MKIKEIIFNVEESLVGSHIRLTVIVEKKSLHRTIPDHGPIELGL